MYGDEQAPYDDGWGGSTTYGSPGRSGRSGRSGGSGGPGAPRRRGTALIATVIAVAAVVLIGAITATRLSGRHHDKSAAGTPTGSHSAAGQPAGSTAKAAKSSAAAAPTSPVHVSLFEGDGQTYGIGMPIIAQFS